MLHIFCSFFAHLIVTLLFIFPLSATTAKLLSLTFTEAVLDVHMTSALSVVGRFEMDA